MDDIKIKQAVKEHYAEVAVKGSSCCSPSTSGASTCCGDNVIDINSLVDYGALKLNVPEGAELGLGCGIPTEHAGLKTGNTVLDLGSGAGVDVFLAAKAVGSTGRAIGVDMTPEMIFRARQNAEKGGYANVEFRLGEIENLPVRDASIDVVLSNCVINLVPDKARAFREVFRVLKPGGHFTISDTVTYGDMPDDVRSSVAEWAGCVAGAIHQDEYIEIVRKAGFGQVEVLAQTDYDYGKGDGYGLASITLKGIKA
ncbi:MAG: arsenite methyltransferase [Anaerolineae bacterium]|nr:MAG: arsenite methyltransferase [Anaerolineae bacterium]